MKDNKTERFTRQRRVLLDELRRVDTHPTADELYELARKKIPNISLGTVYRNLEKFASQGSILKIEHPGDRKRFDGNTTPHLHFKCARCEKIADVFTDKMPDLAEVIDAIKTDAPWISGFTLELTGVCNECATR